MRDPPEISDAISARPKSFNVGEHVLVLARVREGRWTVSVDGRLLEASYDTQADAWEAGVRDAYRLDALRT